MLTKPSALPSSAENALRIALFLFFAEAISLYFSTFASASAAVFFM